MKRSAINAALMLFVAAAVGVPSWRSSRADDVDSVAPPQLSAQATPIDEAEARGLAAALRNAAQDAPGRRVRVRIALRHRPAPVVDGVASPGATGSGSASDKPASVAPTGDTPAAAMATKGAEGRQSRMRRRVGTKNAAGNAAGQVGASGTETPPGGGSSDVARSLVDDADELGKGASRGDKAARRGAAAGAGSKAAQGPEGGQRLHASPDSVKRKGPAQGTGVGSSKGSSSDRGSGKATTPSRGRKVSPVGGAGAAGSGGSGGGGRRAR